MFVWKMKDLWLYPFPMDLGQEYLLGQKDVGGGRGRPTQRPSSNHGSLQVRALLVSVDDVSSQIMYAYISLPLLQRLVPALSLYPPASLYSSIRPVNSTRPSTPNAHPSLRHRHHPHPQRNLSHNRFTGASSTAFDSNILANATHYPCEAPSWAFPAPHPAAPISFSTQHRSYCRLRPAL